MWSKEMGLMAGTFKFQICKLFGKQLVRELCFPETLIKIMVPKIQTILSAENNKMQN